MSPEKTYPYTDEEGYYIPGRPFDPDPSPPYAEYYESYGACGGCGTVYQFRGRHVWTPFVDRAAQTFRGTWQEVDKTRIIFQGQPQEGYTKNMSTSTCEVCQQHLVDGTHLK